MKKSEVLARIAEAYWDAMEAVEEVMSDPTPMHPAKRTLEAQKAILDARAKALSKLAREIEDDPAHQAEPTPEDEPRLPPGMEEMLRAHEGMQIEAIVDQNPYLTPKQRKASIAGMQQSLAEIKAELKERKRPKQ